MKKPWKNHPGVWTAVVLVLALLAWEGAADAGKINVFFFSSPSLVWAEFREMTVSGLLPRHLGVTLHEAGLGLLLGGSLGTAAGLAMGMHPKISQALLPLMTGLNGIPKLALGPLIIIWFGIGLESKVLISTLMVFFVFLFNLYTGVHSVQRELVTAVTLLGASRMQTLTKVVWPACLPWLLTSLRTGLGLSISGAIVGEYLGAGQGLGWYISSAGDRYEIDQVLCCVLVIVVVVVLLEMVVRFLEKRLLRWR